MKTNIHTGALTAKQIRPAVLLPTVLLIATMLFGLGLSDANAKPKDSSIDIVPTITGISLTNGQLVAAGTATATIKGKTTTVPFSGVPVTVSLASNQVAGAACPILDLALGPIELNLLGLLVETSPICVQVTAYDGGGLLGDLLCSVANLLRGGLSLDRLLAGQPLLNPVTGAVVLPGLTPAQLTALLGGLTNIFNEALGNLLDAILEAILDAPGSPACAILNLELGPLELTLLGLEVILDDCAEGPVTVDITALRGGGLLGNLLCGGLGNRINLGSTLGDILDQILALPRM